MIPSQFPIGVNIEKKDIEYLIKKYNADGCVITLEVGEDFFYKGICNDGEDYVTGNYTREELEKEEL